jgi:hypothetical protein
MATTLGQKVPCFTRYRVGPVGHAQWWLREMDMTALCPSAILGGGHVPWGEESGEGMSTGGGGHGQDQLRGVRVSSTASGLQAMRTGAKREVPMPPETFTGVVRPLLSQLLRPLARQVGRSQLETRAP